MSKAKRSILFLLYAVLLCAAIILGVTSQNAEGAGLQQEQTVTITWEEHGREFDTVSCEGNEVPYFHFVVPEDGAATWIRGTLTATLSVGDPITVENVDRPSAALHFDVRSEARDQEVTVESAAVVVTYDGELTDPKLVLSHSDCEGPTAVALGSMSASNKINAVNAFALGLVVALVIVTVSFVIVIERKRKEDD